MLREKIRGGKHKMYSVLHSHLTAVAIDFLKKVHIGAPGPPIAEREVWRTAIIRPKTPIHTCKKSE